MRKILYKQVYKEIRGYRDHRNLREGAVHGNVPPVMALDLGASAMRRGLSAKRRTLSACSVQVPVVDRAKGPKHEQSSSVKG